MYLRYSEHKHVNKYYFDHEPLFTQNDSSTDDVKDIITKYINWIGSFLHQETPAVIYDLSLVYIQLNTLITLIFLKGKSSTNIILSKKEKTSQKYAYSCIWGIWTCTKIYFSKIENTQCPVYPTGWIRSRTLTGVGVKSTARLISSTQQKEYLSIKYLFF